MKKGLESFKAAVLEDTQQYNNCFNENGCDHEFTRMMPETNPALIEMGVTQKCVSVSKCSHKYCDKYKWVIERAKHYALKTGKTFEEIIEIWENDRTYWYMSYYQGYKQPLEGNKNPSDMKFNRDRIKFLESEIETYEYLSTTLTLEHQKSVKNDLITKVNGMKISLRDYQSKIALDEISCYDFFDIEKCSDCGSEAVGHEFGIKKCFDCGHESVIDTNSES